VEDLRQYACDYIAPAAIGRSKIHSRSGLRPRRALKKLFCTAVSGIALFGGSAAAADIVAAAPPMYSPSPLVTYFSWTGCYVGGNVGSVWANKDWIDEIPGDPFFGTDLGTHTVNGLLGGLQAGCNYQLGDWVFGVQGDYDWSSANADNPNLAVPSLTDRSQLKSLTSATGRVGFSWDCFLGYVRFGGAWEKTDYRVLGGFTIATASEMRGGWTAGIGGEYGFSKWLTGFVEYDYYNFGTNVNTFICTTCGPFAAIAPINVRTFINVFKLGLNFKIGPTF
jgi:outer membrane immunogenic protein